MEKEEGFQEEEKERRWSKRRRSTKRQTTQSLTLQGDTGTLVGWNLRISYLIRTLNCTAELGRERKGQQDYIVSSIVHCVTCYYSRLVMFP